MTLTVARDLGKILPHVIGDRTKADQGRGQATAGGGAGFRAGAAGGLARMRAESMWHPVLVLSLVWRLQPVADFVPRSGETGPLCSLSSTGIAWPQAFRMRCRLFRFVSSQARQGCSPGQCQLRICLNCCGDLTAE